ncbi:MAG: amidohydrolase [Flavobacteriaceae bacterium]|nr:amidohydrolase [Flavobacteriaceae bacterium]
MLKKSISILVVCLGINLAMAQNDILLKDYEPRSIYKTQKTTIEKAKFPVIDMHTHTYAKTKAEIDQWIKTMDKFGIKKSIVLTTQTGAKFDSIYNVYSKYEGRFEIWCGFDFTGYNEKGWSKKAIKELERCYKVGARGVGELADKGTGMIYSKPTAAIGMHIDDERMKPLLKRCGELGMPISIHVADPYWMYEPIDKHNDGLMNAAKWKIDTSQKNILLHAELINTLENAVKENRETIFIACHFANCSHDLSILGKLLSTYENLYADISARYGETAPVPRYTNAFYEKHQDKLLYGTDMGLDSSMYQTTFRILETKDEHFYVRELFTYHWPLHGLGLSDTILKKLYYENAEKIIK